ncbi:fumarylacetoacetate hydrolase family protein [Clostridiaceae bacterium HFYG-1003]|nr:fumarylacetoacetate hydrolase family protein [Clostridiaceae bacterium HFYG-1003]
MKLVSFYTRGETHLGVRLEQGILDISDTLKLFPEEGVPGQLSEILVDDRKPLKQLADYVESIGSKGVYAEEAEITYAPCVPKPNKIIGIGLNYYSYLDVCGLPKPDFPRIFSKYSETAAPHRGNVLIPVNTRNLDYEGELAVIIGKTGRMIAEEDAMDYVLGYCNTNDLTCRDFQNLTPSWLPGKTCDTFAPIGPWIVTADEISDPNALSLKTWVNGELRQSSSTADMIFKVPELISGVSKFFTLRPGDIFLTGTPAGVVCCQPDQIKDQLWLKDGDVVEVEIEKLGSLVNYVRLEENDQEEV